MEIFNYDQQEKILQHRIDIWIIFLLDRGNHHEFLSLVKELARPGDITQNTSFDFEFNQVEKPYECYTGANVKLRWVENYQDVVKYRLLDYATDFNFCYSLDTFCA